MSRRRRRCCWGPATQLRQRPVHSQAAGQGTARDRAGWMTGCGPRIWRRTSYRVGDARGCGGRRDEFRPARRSYLRGRSGGGCM